MSSKTETIILPSVGRLPVLQHRNPCAQMPECGLRIEDTLCTNINREPIMPKYVIEREIPRPGDLSPQQLHAIAQTPSGLLCQMGPHDQWAHRYVPRDRTY